MAAQQDNSQQNKPMSFTCRRDHFTARWHISQKIAHSTSKRGARHPDPLILQGFGRYGHFGPKQSRPTGSPVASVD
jgi:hypothetical protein